MRFPIKGNGILGLWIWTFGRLVLGLGLGSWTLDLEIWEPDVGRWEFGTASKFGLV